MTSYSPKLKMRIWKRIQDACSIAPVVLTENRHLGAGWVHAMIPIARQMYGDDKAAIGKLLQRHNGFIGCHPDFMSMAAGAVARCEFETGNKTNSLDQVRSLREWCSTALQVYGWQLFRDGWRPLTMIIGLLIGLFAYHRSNATRATAIMLFLLIYNIPIWTFRLWSVGYGWRKGVNLPGAMALWPWRKILWSIRLTGAGLVGAAFVLTAREWGRIVYTLGSAGAEGLAWITVAVGFLIGYLLQPRIPLYALLLLLTSIVLSVAWFL